MKQKHRIVSTLLACLFVTTAFSACDFGGMGGGSSSSDGSVTQEVETLSSSILDGKVANLMSATGIGIQDKNQTGTAREKQSKARMVTAQAEESTTSQARNEFVKETENGVQDVHFLDSSVGSYRDLNKRYAQHHHNGQTCSDSNCERLSDEVTLEEVQSPTVVSSNARVNKLYKAGRFSFMCVSSAVEGNVRVLTYMQPDGYGLSIWAYNNWNAWLNSEEHYVSNENMNRCVSYMEVQSGDKKGVILVKRSEAETGYHYANYWSDDFNQSFIIDNQTGKTYSLSQFPRIYSVQNGLVQVMQGTNGVAELYKPQVVDGQLQLKKLVFTAEHTKYSLNNPMADIHGNVVFYGGNRELAESNEYGEVRIGEFIFTGCNPQVKNMIINTNQNRMVGEKKAQWYQQARRYHLGNDGQIYRLDFRGEMNRMALHVLNAQGEWVNVPSTSTVTFSGANGWIGEMSVHAGMRQYVIMTQISGGKTFLANAALGSDFPFTSGADAHLYEEYGFVGIAALPTDGSEDTAITEFMREAVVSGVMQSKDIVYRVGNTAFAYQDRSTNELVIWDRATETKKRIAVGQALGSLGQCLMPTNASTACFQASTVNGIYYVDYNETKPTQEWSQHSRQVFQAKAKLDAYYQLLVNA